MGKMNQTEKRGTQIIRYLMKSWLKLRSHLKRKIRYFVYKESLCTLTITSILTTTRHCFHLKSVNIDCAFSFSWCSWNNLLLSRIDGYLIPWNNLRSWTAHKHIITNYRETPNIKYSQTCTLRIGPSVKGGCRKCWWLEGLQSNSSN